MLYNNTKQKVGDIAMIRYKGKIISILGDSISTFAGYIPEADGVNLKHRPRYPQDNLLTDVNDTWWMKLINTLGAKLGVNDSWAGSTVSNFRDHNEKDFGPDAAMASQTRIRNLAANGTPDLILFFGGTNDAGKMIEKGRFNPAHKLNLTSYKWDSFAEAYSETLLRLRYFYPDSEIVAISPSISGGYYDNSRLSEFADLALEICLHYSIECVDIRFSGLTLSMLPDTLHPNAQGMECIYQSVLNKLKEDNK